MACLVLPVSILMRRRRYTWPRRLGYQPLEEEGYRELEAEEGPVTVVVGKEKRVFLVDPFVLEENPFRVLIDHQNVKKESGCCYRNSSRNDDDDDDDDDGGGGKKKEKRMIFVDVDSILFEHMLWLMYNDCSSLFQLNVREIIDFYTDE